ncbi:MAG: nucleotide exchange factor GrpE, partial [Patescibacteria group bacterium]
MKLTPIADNFRRAFADENTDSKAWQAGVEQIQRQIDELLTANDVVRLEVVGVAFDPSQHEALSQLSHDTIPEGHIIQEIEAGYQYRGTIVKPAKVVVSTGQPA